MGIFLTELLILIKEHYIIFNRCCYLSIVYFKAD